MEPGSIPCPVVTTARMGSLPTAATMRRSRSSWFWKSALSATRTSGSVPGGGVHSPAHTGSSRRGPTCLTVGGSGPMKSNARLVITSTRATLRPWSRTCSSGSRPCSERAALSAGRASSQPAIMIAASSSSRRRSASFVAGISPAPNGGTPGAGTTLMVGFRTMQGTCAASAATCGPKSRSSVSTAAAGRRASSSRTSAANAAAGPTASRSRIRAKPSAGSSPAQSSMKWLLGERSVRCGARVQLTCSAPVASTSGLNTGSASTRRLCPRSTSARATLISGGVVPEPSQVVINRWVIWSLLRCECAVPPRARGSR